MLKCQNLTQIQGITPFIFSELCPRMGSSSACYHDTQGNEYQVLSYQSFREVQIINYLSSYNLVLNYQGALYSNSNSIFYIFTNVNKIHNLNHYIHNCSLPEKGVDQRFCVQLIETILMIFKKLEGQRIHLKVLTPESIGVRNMGQDQGHDQCQDQQSEKNYDFGLLLPLSAKHFDSISKQEYQLSLPFAAPELINYFVSNQDFQTCQKQFRKSCLYSLGLIILYCFGSKFSASERIEWAKNNKNFKIFFKKIRQEIKMLHGGKYIPKALKLLLEVCEKSRDIIETFDIKIHSRQFYSLKVNGDPNGYSDIKVSTKYTQNDIRRTDRSKQMIQISINSLGSALSPYTPKNLSEKQQSPIGIQISEQNEQKVKQDEDEQNISFGFLSIEGPQQMMGSFKKSAQIRMEATSKMPDDEPIIKYNPPDQLRYEERMVYGYSHQNNQNNEESLNFDEELEVEQEQEEEEENLAMKQEFRSQSRMIMLAFVLTLFLYGLISMLRDS